MGRARRKRRGVSLRGFVMGKRLRSRHKGFTETRWGTLIAGAGDCETAVGKAPGGDYVVYMRRYEGAFYRPTLKEAKKYALELVDRCKG